jgi:hypothetical protein
VFLGCYIQSIRKPLKLDRQINKIFLENMKRTGTVVQVDVSSVAECDLPSSTSFHYGPPNKEPDIRCASTEYRALGLKPLATHDPNQNSAAKLR